MLNKLIHFNLCVIVLCLPLYLLRLKIWWIPTTVLELMIYAVFVLWLIKIIIVRATRPSFAKQNLGGESRTITSRLARRIKSPKNKFWFYPIFLIFFGATISTLFSSDLRVSAGLWKAYFLDPLLFLIVLVETVKTKKQIKDIMTAFSLSGLTVAVISLWYWFNGQLTYDGRLRAFYLSPNHLAMYIAPCLLMSFGLWQFLKNKWQKILLFTVHCSLFTVHCSLFTVHCSLFIVLYLTYSYGAWLGVIGALVFILISKYSGNYFCKPTKKFLWLLILLLFMALFIFTQWSSQKFQDFLFSSRSSWQSRLIIWRVAGSIIKDHPLMGIGPGMFQKYYLDYQPKFEPYLEWAVPQPHNIFLAFWLQTGLLGLLGFIWLLVKFFRNTLRKVSGFKFYISGAMIYLLLHGLVDTPYWKNDLAMIFWLMIALSIVRPSFNQD